MVDPLDHICRRPAFKHGFGQTCNAFCSRSFCMVEELHVSLGSLVFRVPEQPLQYGRWHVDVGCERSVCSAEVV